MRFFLAYVICSVAASFRGNNTHPIMKKYFITSIVSFITLYCSSQTTTDTLKLQRLIFHSSRCNGTCPSIDLEIDSNRNIVLTREIYKSKSGIDRSLSGQFRGTISAEDYAEIKNLLQASELSSLQFPAVDCCDGPVKTIIVYYNNNRKYLRSMIPPEKAHKLISFLTQIGTQSFERVNEVASIEE